MRQFSSGQHEHAADNMLWDMLFLFEPDFLAYLIAYVVLLYYIWCMHLIMPYFPRCGS